MSEIKLEIGLYCSLRYILQYYVLVLGMVLGNLIADSVSSQFPESWPLMLGALFVLVGMVLPKGIVGIIEQLWERANQEKEIGPEGDPVAFAYYLAGSPRKGTADSQDKATQLQKEMIDVH